MFGILTTNLNFMGKLSFKTKIKNFISSIGWEMFIWGSGITQEEYWQRIYQQEKNFIEENLKK